MFGEQGNAACRAVCGSRAWMPNEQYFSMWLHRVLCKVCGSSGNRTCVASTGMQEPDALTCCCTLFRVLKHLAGGGRRRSSALTFKPG